MITREILNVATKKMAYTILRCPCYSVIIYVSTGKYYLTCT